MLRRSARLDTCGVLPRLSGCHLNDAAIVLLCKALPNCPHLARL